MQVEDEGEFEGEFEDSYNEFDESQSQQSLVDILSDEVQMSQIVIGEHSNQPQNQEMIQQIMEQEDEDYENMFQDGGNNGIEMDIEFHP